MCSLGHNSKTTPSFACSPIWHWASYFSYKHKIELKKKNVILKICVFLIADLLYVIVGISHIIVIFYFEYDFRTTSNFICSFHSFLTIYLSHLASNIQAAIGVFRCIKVNFSVRNFMHSVKQPQKKSYWLSGFGRGDFIILLICVTLLVLDGHYLIWMRLTGEKHFHNNTLDYMFANATSNFTLQFICYPSRANQVTYYWFYTTVWTLVDMFLYSYIPFSIMSVSSGLIAYKLFYLTKNQNQKAEAVAVASPLLPPAFGADKFKHLTSSSNQTLRPLTITSTNSRQPKTEKSALVNQPNTHAKRNQTYKLLLILNILFFMLVTPLVVANAMGLLENELCREVVYFLAYLNNCHNILFYFLSSHVYRDILVAKLVNLKRVFCLNN